MRAEPVAGEVPALMQGAWHLDVHRGPMPGLLEPSELVRASRAGVGEITP